MSTDQQNHVDIAIVGAGMVGASLARLLAPLPIKVALIDQREFSPVPLACDSSTEDFDPRVSALTEASRELFQKIGLWSAMAAKRVSPYLDMQVWDADGTGSVEFSAAKIGSSELGHIVENSVVLAALHDSLSSIENLQLIGGAAIEDLSTSADGSVSLTTESGLRLSASLLVAADGGNSLLRRLAGFETRTWNYDHTAIVTTVKTEKPHHATALQRFITTGPLAFLPLLPEPGSSNQHYCSIVWSCVPELAAALMKKSDDEFRQALEQGIEARLGEIQWCGKRFSVPLRQMHARQYSKESIVLVGDAAHTIHPLAGQGVNLGLLDVKVLAEELANGLAHGRSLNDPIVLGRYERKRRGHNLSTMWMMEGFKHLFAEEALPVRWLRNMGLRSVDNLPLLKNQIARKAMGLDL